MISFNVYSRSFSCTQGCYFIFQVLFDPFGYLRRFENVVDICKEFFEIRKKKYIERKSFQEGLLRAQSERLSNQVIFFNLSYDSV